MLDPENSVVVALTKEARDALTPDEILERAKAGNARFHEGRRIERDFLAEQRATAAGQYPAAVLLGCIDSRSPAEIIFNLGLGTCSTAASRGTSRTTTSSPAWSSRPRSPGPSSCSSWGTRAAAP